MLIIKRAGVKAAARYKKPAEAGEGMVIKRIFQVFARLLSRHAAKRFSSLDLRDIKLNSPRYAPMDVSHSATEADAMPISKGKSLILDPNSLTTECMSIAII